VPPATARLHGNPPERMDARWLRLLEGAWSALGARSIDDIFMCPFRWLCVVVLLSSCGPGLRSDAEHRGTPPGGGSTVAESLAVTHECPVAAGNQPLHDCMALLASSSIKGANDCFRNSSGAEAAFGYAFTGLLMLPNSSDVQDVLGKLHQPSWKPSDSIFGENGFLARTQAAWGGQAQVTIDAIPVNFDRVRAMSGGGQSVIVYLRSTTSPLMRLDFSLSAGSNLTQNIGMGGGASATWTPSDYPSYYDANGTLMAQNIGWNVGDAVQFTADFTVTDTVKHTMHVVANATQSGCITVRDEMPFTQIHGSGMQNLLNQLLVPADQDLTVAQAVRATVKLVPRLNDIAACLEFASQKSVDFAVPAGLHFSTTDVHVRAAESAAIAAATRAFAGGVLLVGAYDWNVRVGDVVANGSVDLKRVANLLNQHLMRLQDATYLGYAQAHLDAAAGAFGALVDLIPSAGPAPAGAWVDASKINPAQVDFIRRLAEAAAQLTHNGVNVPNMQPPLTLLWSSAFDKKPLDASKLDVYPFDYDPAVGLKVVESFWRKLAAGRMNPDFVDGSDAPDPRFVNNPFAKGASFVTHVDIGFPDWATEIGCR
jgi:hypothetical protein